MAIQSISDIPLTDKPVFIRVDFNVPLKDGVITDDTRIRAAIPTIQYAIQQNARVILASHLGRPKGDGFEQNFSLSPVAERLAELLNQDVIFPEDCVGGAVSKLISELESGHVMLLENLRFHKEETANNKEFARQLAKHIKVYINDAFGTAHRAHASTVGMVEFVPEKGAGFLLAKEISFLQKVIKNPGHPFVVIVGGAKVSDKLGLLENLVTIADTIIVGGGMAYTFLKAKGYSVGNSLVDESKLFMVKKLLRRAETNDVDIILPVDHVGARNCNATETPIPIDKVDIPEGVMGLDIGRKSIAAIATALKGAKTIVWNGPLGVFEIPAFSEGTLSVAGLVASSGATTVVGGGDSVAAINQAGVANKISHISTGGGASLEYLEGKTLPGIKILEV